MYVYRDKRFTKPKLWGNPFWNYMFMYSKFSDKSKITSLEHFKTLSFFVPCNKCRSCFRKKLRYDPPPDGQNELFEWIWKYKNEVNQRQRTNSNLNKKDISLKRAKQNQYKLNDSSVFSFFFEILILSMPTLPHQHRFRAQKRYNVNHVSKKIRKLVQDIWDNPSMSVLLTSIHQEL